MRELLQTGKILAPIEPAFSDGIQRSQEILLARFNLITNVAKSVPSESSSRENLTKQVDEVETESIVIAEDL